MMKNFIAIILVALLSVASFVAAAPASSADLEQCPEENIQFGKKDVGHNFTTCPPDGEDEESWTSTPEMSEPRKPKSVGREKKGPQFKIKDLDMCMPGREQANQCRSNPDIKSCPDGTYPVIRQILGVGGSNKGKVIRQYIFCPGDKIDLGVPEEEVVREIRITIDMFRKYPIKGSAIQSTPNKFSLRNGHTHFWASHETQEFNSNLSGSDVRIKAIPIQWNWNYGDGATKNLVFPGEAMPSHTLREETKTSHSFTKTGKFGVRATTLYRGEFSVDGGPWQAIPGQAAVPSNMLPIDVWRTKKELIAND